MLFVSILINVARLISRRRRIHATILKVLLFTLLVLPERVLVNEVIIRVTPNAIIFIFYFGFEYVVIKVGGPVLISSQRRRDFKFLVLDWIARGRLVFVERLHHIVVGEDRIPLILTDPRGIL